MADILVLGATGYTGQLVVEYLAKHPQRSSFVLGLGARSQSKLADVRKKLRLDKDESIKEFYVDVTNPEEVDKVVQAAKVVINTVGPFWRWGTPVVKACARHGVHYVDITGEPHWVREVILECDYLAGKTHALIIPACGFDSVPSDISVFVSNKTLKGFAGPDANIEESVSAFDVKGAMSGGTLQTLISMLEEVPRDKLKLGFRDYALSTGLKGPRTPRKLIYTLPFSSPTQYGGTFFMTGANRAIVQRTWGVNELRAMETTSPDAKIRSYGPKFKYIEFKATSGKFSSLVLSLGLAFSAICLMFPPIRWLFKRLIPEAGFGPTEQQLRDGFFKVTNVTSSVAAPSKPRTHVRTVFSGQGDPGYALASVMVAEAALTILLDRGELPEVAREGGVLTPASALGDAFVQRLEATGRFTIQSEVVLGQGDESRKTR